MKNRKQPKITKDIQPAINLYWHALDGKIGFEIQELAKEIEKAIHQKWLNRCISNKYPLPSRKESREMGAICIYLKGYIDGVRAERQKKK